MARYMVSECGMNDVVGPMYVSEGDSRHNVLSETVKERIDAQVRVRNVLVEARTGVMELLQSHVTELHSLAGALIEVETLTSKQCDCEGLHGLIVLGSLMELCGALQLGRGRLMGRQQIMKQCAWNILGWSACEEGQHTAAAAAAAAVLLCCNSAADLCVSWIHLQSYSRHRISIVYSLCVAGANKAEALG
eukprot:1151437-Pelagomonas_calceolata.AAC.2